MAIFEMCWNMRSTHAVILTLVLVSVGAYGQCKDLALNKRLCVNILSQSRPEWEFLQNNISDFTDKEGIDVRISYLSESEERARVALDASTESGKYQIYYVEASNVKEFAQKGWLLPLSELYPPEYEIGDFLGPLLDAFISEGVIYGVPTDFDGEVMVSRKDLLSKSGLTVPRSLAEYLSAVNKLHSPPGIYGTAVVGLGGERMNVRSFSPYLFMFGGRFLDDAGDPVFNSSEAVKAVEYYIELIKRSPSPTMTPSTIVEEILSGKIAASILSSQDALYIAQRMSKLTKLEFSGPVDGPSGRSANLQIRGLCISRSGCKTDDLRVAAGKFIGWWTSKLNEERKRKGGYVLATVRKSTFTSGDFEKTCPEDLGNALAKAVSVRPANSPSISQWPRISNYFGMKLEELFMRAFDGEDYVVKPGLDDSVNYAKGLLGISPN